MEDETASDGAGARQVQARLQATLAALAELEALAVAATDMAGGDARLDEPIGVALVAARRARQGLEAVQTWLDTATATGSLPARASLIEAEPDTSAPAAPTEADESPTVKRLVVVLRTAIEDLEELGETLEEDDPIVHFDAVQAIGLAGAVLEAAHQRLLRAGLARPRPVNLMAP